MNYTYSIVIPHYDSVNYLTRMLTTIPEREDIQIIVVDDLSPSNSVKRLQELRHTNLEIYFQTENKGAGAARNVGITHAKGKWLLVVDPDDTFSNNAFSVLDKELTDSIDYLCYRINHIDGISLQPIPKEIVSDHSVRVYIEQPSEKTKRLFKFKNTVCWNKVVSLEFIRKNHISFEECRVNNDVLYTFYIAMYTKRFKVISDKLYNFHDNATSLTRNVRTIEKELDFYLMAQKRNGLFEAMGMKYYPFYRINFLYIPIMIKRRGLLGAWAFYELCKSRKRQIVQAREEYKKIFENVDFQKVLSEY